MPEVCPKHKTPRNPLCLECVDELLAEGYEDRKREHEHLQKMRPSAKDLRRRIR